MLVKMMFILFIVPLLFHHSRSFEWNCTENKQFLFSNDQIYEQCTITIEYVSLQQEKQVCIAHTLSIKSLPIPSFSMNYTMKTFQLNSCQLLTLNQLPFTLPSSVEILDLSYNLLTTLTLSFPLPSHLKYLYLDQNPNLSQIDFSHDQIEERLISLSLRHNKYIQLSSLPMNLRRLDLTDCNIKQSSISTLFQSLKKLTHLSLANNQLERLPILDKKLKFEYLNLSNNHLTWIDNSWFDIQLQVLDLRFNQIKSLEFLEERLKSDQIFEQDQHDRTMANHTLQLSLHGNPLICDCWLNSIMNSSSIKLTDVSLLQCNSYPILSIPTDEFLCSYVRHCASECSCCDFEACDCHSVCPSECLCSHNALWSQHLVKCQQVNLSNIHVLLPETITELDYQGNHIEQIKPFVFAGKTLLTKINLAENNLHELTNETFCSASNLREINLSYNRNLMAILPELNDLFGCLKYLEEIILSHDQINGKESISPGWTIDSDDDDGLIRITRQMASVSLFNSTFGSILFSTNLHPVLEATNQPSTIFSLFQQQSLTSSSFIQQNQTLILIVFFLLCFVLLFLLLLISLAICRRKLRRHITAELDRQRSQHYYCHSHLHQSSIKIPESNGTLGVNDSVYEQLPSLSSDSEQPFLYNDKKSITSNAPALPPYPPSLRHYHCCHSPNRPEYQYTVNPPPNVQQSPCPAVLILGNQMIYPNTRECLSELQQNLLINSQETVFVPNTLCRCNSHMKNIDTYAYPNVHR